VESLWEQLSGGGPIQTNPERTASPALRLENRNQAPALTIRLIQQKGKDKENTPRKAGGGKPFKGNGDSPDLSSMDSLRGPLARQNRANFNSGQVNSTRDREPREIRCPHNAKRWRLGVGQVRGERNLEGVFAMRKVGTEGIIFTTGQLICPFRRHQQSKRPTHLNNHAWAHNGIPEGTVGCLYINAYNNTDSPVRWIRMAGHEALANCKIRSMPISQGGGG
jgi:hypothetical protein